MQKYVWRRYYPIQLQRVRFQEAISVGLAHGLGLFDKKLGLLHRPQRKKGSQLKEVVFWAETGAAGALGLVAIAGEIVQL